MAQPPSTEPAGDRQLARRLIAGAFRARRRQLVAAIAGAALYTVSMLLVPLLSKVVLDGIVAHRPLHDLTAPLVGLLLVGLGRAGAGALRKFHATKFMALVSLDLRDRLYRHFQRLSFAFHDRLGPGELMSRVAGDVTVLEQTVGMLPYSVQSVALGVCGAILLFALQPVLAAIVVVAMAVLSVGALRMGRVLYPLSRKIQDRLGDFGQFVEQQVNGVRVIKGHGFEMVSLARGARHSDEVRDLGVQLARQRARFVTVFSLGPSVAVLMIVGPGVWLGARGRMSAGDLFAFLQYLGLLVAPVMVAAQALVMWPQAVGSACRVAEILDAEPDVSEPLGPTALPPGNGTVRFEDVWFGYHPSKPVLNGFDLTIEAGTSVALVGASGAGKTTAAYLIPRFYDPWGGRVLLDGLPVRDLSLPDLRRAVSIVFEDTVIFSDTIRSNITMAKPDATDADVADAARRAHAADFIEALPLGYDTVVGEQGASLSGGQRQRIAIARAILARPRLLILDDATSAVDPGTDEAIRQSLAEVLKGRTAIIVAHRVETLELADRVVLVDGGRVVADGTHEALLAVPAYRTALALDEEVAV
ncbi:MAG TPA: ABC transporter ATP-binding protein [Acidimicrobiales bacterium]|nr:ABC transporter ATP-binding protein [Acidimicrobiales bacterium]